MPEPSERPGRTAAQNELRQLNLRVLPLVAFPGLMFIWIDGHSWFHVLLLSSTMALAVYAFVRWADFELERVALPALLYTALVYPVATLFMNATGAYFALALVASLVIPQMRRGQKRAGIALMLYIAGIGLVAAADHELFTTRIPGQQWRLLLAYVLVPTLVAAAALGSMFPSERLYGLVKELEDSRRQEAELAVARERIRFAGDLHDIQGHTLHVVKLKARLASKLVRNDPDRAEEELREIHALVGDTIARTKELAYAQRQLNLAAEVENAKNLFEAAGIRVRIVREAEMDPGAGQMLGQVLRETTTNILRHAQATNVRITLAERRITIVNDGVADEPLPALRGLDTLRQRLKDEGGQLAVQQEGGSFTTAAVFGDRHGEQR